MASLDYGYRFGPRVPVYMGIDSSSADIVVGDIITVDGSSNLAKRAAAGDVCYGVAMSTVSAPSADGGAKVLVDVSQESVYAYPPDAGTVAATLRFKTMDVGGPQSINIDASTDDCIAVVDVDTANNLVLVQIRPALAGVV